MNIEQAARELKRGEVVIFPTETVYGLGASLFFPKAIQKIFLLKGRPADNPVIVHVEGIEQAASLAEELPPSFFSLAQRFWPGPLTLVVKRREGVPGEVSGGLASIAIRSPVHPVARELIRAAGPLAAPSANRSGRPSPTCLADALEDFEGKVPVALDGGSCSIGIESTVVSLLGATPVLLRPGSITREQIEEVLGEKVALPSQGGPILSPGMKYRHYAPKAKIRLVYDEKELRGERILRSVCSETLYAQLRASDRMGVAEIAVLCTPEMQADPALMDRLLRAAGR